MAKKTKKRIVLTKELKKFIVDKISSGMDMTTVCEKYEDKLPSYRSIQSAQQKDNDFYLAVAKAYDHFFEVKFSELERLSTEETPAHVKEDKFSLQDYHNSKRLRVDTLKFMLAKLAPMLSKRWESVSRKGIIEAQQNVGTQIIVKNYARSDEGKEKVINKL